MPDSTPLAQVAALIPDQVERHYGPDRRVAALSAACSAFSGRSEAVDAGNLAALQSAVQVVFRHLELSLDNNLEPEERSGGWPPADLAAARRSGAGVAAVRDTWTALR